MASSGLIALNQSMTAKPFAAAKYRYPRDLNPGTQPFVHFEVRDAVATDAPVLSNFVLYMPPTIKTNYRGKWEDVEMEWKKVWNAGTDIVKLDNLGSRLLVAGSNILGNATGTNARAQAEVAQGFLLNPHAALQFKGMEFREFRMEYHFMARNKDESEQIQNIIQALRFHMHPDINNKSQSSYDAFWFSYPDHFNIRLYSPSDKFLFRFHDCILLDCEVDYAGSGVPSFYTENGAPVDIRVGLTFKELSILTKNDFRLDEKESTET